MENFSPRFTPGYILRLIIEIKHSQREERKVVWPVGMQPTEEKGRVE